MRLAVVIIFLTSIAVGLVHLRRAEITAKHAAQRLQMKQVTLRRKLWDQQNHLSRLTLPQEVNRRYEELKRAQARREAPAGSGQGPVARYPGTR